MSCYYFLSCVIYVSPIYSRIHVDMSFSSRNYIFFLLARLLFGTKWWYFIVELIFFFWNINSTIISWLIYTFSSQLNTFCILHVIPYFHKGKVHNLNYHPLQYFCMLGFWDTKCVWKLYVEGFIDIFGDFFFLFFHIYLI